MPSAHQGGGVRHIFCANPRALRFESHSTRPHVIPCVCLGKGVSFGCIAFLSTAAPAGDSPRLE